MPTRSISRVVRDSKNFDYIEPAGTTTLELLTLF